MQTLQPEISIRKESNGSTRVELILDDQPLSWLSIVPFTLRIGEAEIRMDGISGVGTDDEHRMKGYSRRVLEATVEEMTRGDAAVSMLYGIRDFYPKFGYATAGPEHYIFLTNLKQNSELPEGWSVRSFAGEDFPAVKGIYDRCISVSTGAAVRSEGCHPWCELIQMAGDCRVVVGPDGKVHGYALLAHWCWTGSTLARRYSPDALVIGEAIADSPKSADALLAACRLWALETEDVKEVCLPVPPGTHVATAAMYQDARVVREFQSCGASMVRVLDVKRLLESLKPEISSCLKAARSTFTGTLTIRTDIGEATLSIDRDNVHITEAQEGPAINMPHTALGRLALGVFPPEDILARLPEPPDDEVSDLLRTIFPLRHQHMYVADRY